MFVPLNYHYKYHSLLEIEICEHAGITKIYTDTFPPAQPGN